jgi:hypothetical protein
LIHYLLDNFNISLDYDEISNVSMTTFSPSILKLIPEVEYIVSINNIDYTLIAQEKLDGNKKIVFIGNETLNEIESLPFLIEYEYNI